MGITGLPEYQIRRNVNEREANRKTGSGSSCGGNACHGAKPQYSVESFLSSLHQIDPLLWTAVTVWIPKQKGPEEKGAGKAGESPVNQRVPGMDGSERKKWNGANSKTMKRRKGRFFAYAWRAGRKRTKALNEKTNCVKRRYINRLRDFSGRKTIMYNLVWHNRLRNHYDRLRNHYETGWNHWKSTVSAYFYEKRLIFRSML